MRRVVTVLAVIVVIGVAIWDTDPVARSATSTINPTMAAIRTRGAELSATFTARPATPVVSRTFTYVDPWSKTEFSLSIMSVTVSPARIAGVARGDYRYPRGKFVILTVTLVNSGRAPVTLFGYDGLLLIDDQGRMFSSDDDATLAVMFSRDLYVSAYQPSLSYTQVIVWDVAKDANTLALIVKGTDTHIPIWP